MDLTAWCTARGFNAKTTAVVVDAYVDLDTLRMCADDADSMDEALTEVGLAIGPRKVVLKAVRTLLEPATPVAAPPPVQFAAPQPANVAAPQPVRAPAPVSPEPDPKPVQASTPPEPPVWGSEPPPPPPLPDDGLAGLSVKALKAMAAARGVDISRCCEKSEIVELLRAPASAAPRPASPAPAAEPTTSYVMHATTSTERECLAKCVLGCSSNRKQVTAGSRIYLLNIQKREARGPLIALGAAGKNLVRGAFGGRFDLHVQFQKTAKPPVVWVCGADDALPPVGPWAPPQPRADDARAAARRAREDEERARRAREDEARERERKLLDDAAAQQRARAAARQAARAKIAAEREERERRERADAAAKAEARRARDAKRAATRRDLAAARLAERRNALERRSEPSRIVIDVANVGHWNASSDGGVTFNWDQVAEVCRYYQKKKFRPLGFLSVHTNNRNPMPRNWPFKDCVSVAAGRDGSIVTNDNFRGWEERLPDEDAAFLERFRNELHVNYVFVGGEFVPGRPPFEFRKEEDSLSDHDSDEEKDEEHVKWGLAPMRSLVRVLRMSYVGDADAVPIPFDQPASTSVADALRTYAARTGRCFTTKNCFVFDGDGAPLDARDNRSLDAWRMDAGETISVFDAGSLFAEIKSAAGAASTVYGRATIYERLFSARDAAVRAVAPGNDDRRVVEDFMAALLVVKGRSTPPTKRRFIYTAWQSSRDPAFCRALYELLSEGSTTLTMKTALVAGFLSVLRATGTTDESAVLSLCNWWLRDDGENVETVFARKSLLCGSSVAPYAGHRLVGVPVQLEGSDTTCSLGALSAGQGGTIGAADIRVDAVAERALRRHAGSSALLLVAPRSSGEARTPGSRVLEAFRRDCAARTTPLAVQRAAALKDPSAEKPALVYDFTSRLAVCTSCGETQTDKSQQEGARAKTLTLFRPSTGTSTSVDPDELALAHDRQTLPCLTSGSNIRSATVVVLDVSTSMGLDYSRFEAVDSDEYDRTEVRVAGLRYDDPDPKATARAALPKSVQPMVRKMDLLKLKADDARGAKGSFGGTVFVDLGSVAVARTALAASRAGSGRLRITTCRGGAKKDNRRARDQHPTRLRAVTEAFKVLADRAMALEGGTMALGLVTFSDGAREVTPVKAALRGFQHDIDAVEPNGETALWDALALAVSKLVAFAESERRRDPAMPRIKLRIVALTDGEDTSSSTSRAAAAKAALAAQVTVDAIRLGPDAIGLKLAALARLTGGAVHKPEDLGELCRVCEAPTFVAGTEEARSQLPSTATVAQIEKKLKELDRRRDRDRAAPAPEAQKPTPAALNLDLVLATQPARNVTRALATKVRRGGAEHGQSRAYRLMRDLAEAHRDADPVQLRIFTCEDQIDAWRVLLAAPQHSDYAGGCYEICITYPEGYPQEPPKVVFVTPILHPNVGMNGRACHSILGTAWNPELGGLDVITAITSMLVAPDPDDAMDQRVALLFRSNTWQAKVREHVKQHASKSLEELTRAVEEEDEASDDEINNSGSTLLLTNDTALCPLTGEPPRDPVYVRDTGIIYSQAALLARCEKVGVLHCPASTRASGQTVVLDEENVIPLDQIDDQTKLSVFLTAREADDKEKDERVECFRSAEADAAAVDEEISTEDVVEDDSWPRPLEAVAAVRCYNCEKVVSPLEVVTCAVSRRACYCSLMCLATHADRHAMFCVPCENNSADDDAVALATRSYDKAVAAAHRGDVAACQDFVRRALETIEKELLPRSAFISDAAFNIPAAVRKLFHDVINLGAKAALIGGNKDAARRYRATLRALGTDMSDGPGFVRPLDSDDGPNHGWIAKVNRQSAGALRSELAAHGVPTEDVADVDIAPLVCAARRRTKIVWTAWMACADPGEELVCSTVTVDGKTYENVEFEVPEGYDKWMPHQLALRFDTATSAVVRVEVARFAKAYWNGEESQHRPKQLAAPRPITDSWDDHLAVSVDLPGDMIKVEGREGTYAVPPKFNFRTQGLALRDGRLISRPLTAAEKKRVAKALELSETRYYSTTDQYADEMRTYFRR